MTFAIVTILEQKSGSAICFSPFFGVVLDQSWLRQGHLVVGSAEAVGSMFELAALSPWYPPNSSYASLRKMFLGPKKRGWYWEGLILGHSGLSISIYLLFFVVGWFVGFAPGFQLDFNRWTEIC